MDARNIWRWRHETNYQKQSEWIRFAILMVSAAVLYGINLAFNAGYVNRWVALVLTIVVMFGALWTTKKVLVRQTKRGRAKKSRITKRFRAQEGWIYEARPSGIFPSGANHDRIFCSIDFLSHSVRWRVNRGAFVSAGGRCSGFCAGHSQYDGAKE